MYIDVGTYVSIIWMHHTLRYVTKSSVVHDDN